jgi:CPA1 family monovalent cation:H+ antiporter
MANRRLQFLSSSSRIRGYGVWESFVFILNGIVFLIIGLDLPEIVEGLRSKGIPLHTAIGYGVLVTGVLVLARIISSYTAMVATIIFRPKVINTRSNRMRFLMPLFLGWTGMRGVVSLAAALSIPVTLAGGIEFPYRNLILFITFVVILLTLLVQGLTLPYFIKRLRLFDAFPEEPEDEARQKMIRELREHTHKFLKSKTDNELYDHAGMQKLLQHWEEKTKAADDDWMNEHARAIYLEMLQSQREYLTTVNKDPAISEEIVRWQLYQIDLEEERLNMQ